MINKPQFNQVSDELLAFIEGATLIIHNAPFDLGFLNNELKIMGTEIKIENFCSIIDTLELSKEQRPGTMHNLDALCRRFGIDTSARTRHGALLDSQILAQVYIAMTGGQSILFKEEIKTKHLASDPILVNKLKEESDNIKVVYASSEEVNHHQNYFKK